jgi:hypothetical protein
MRNLLIISILIFSFGLSTSVFAEDKGKHKGPEISVEHKSEQGLEHGKAYAGTKEKKDKGDKDKGDKEEKKDKGDKDKGDKEEKKDNGLPQVLRTPS